MIVFVCVCVCVLHRRRRQRLAARLAGVPPMDLMAALGMQAAAKGVRFQWLTDANALIAVAIGVYSKHSCIFG